MITHDLVNGLFEFFGCLFIVNHCRVLYNEKNVAGISIVSTLFFLLWGLWNVYYYPTLNQWFSLAGGVFITMSNIIWVCMLIYYKLFYNERKING